MNSGGILSYLFEVVYKGLLETVNFVIFTKLL